MTERFAVRFIVTTALFIVVGAFLVISLMLLLWLEGNETAARLRDLVGPTTFVPLALLSLGACVMVASGLTCMLVTGASSPAGAGRGAIRKEYGGLSFREAGWSLILPQTAWALSSDALRTLQRGLGRYSPPAALCGAVLVTIAAPAGWRELGPYVWVACCPLFSASALWLAYVDHRRCSEPSSGAQDPSH